MLASDSEEPRFALLPSGGPLEDLPLAAGRLVHAASALAPDDEGELCRICLSEDDPQDLIAPCNCAGSAKYVHRDCLDEWRASVDRPRAFSHCAVCTREFTLLPTRPHSALWKRQAKFKALVARDFFLAFLLCQACIVALGAIVRALDGALATCLPGCQPAAGASEPGACVACAPIKHTFFPAMLSDGEHEKTYMYLCGLVMFLALIGMVGACGRFCGASMATPPPPVQRAPSLRHLHSAESPQHGYGAGPRRGVRGYPSCDCYVCFSDRDCERCMNRCCDCERCGDGCCDCRSLQCVCPQCNCPAHGGGGGDGNDNCLVLLLAVMVFVLLAFAVVGVFYGLVMMSIFVQRTVQRHYHHLQLRALAKDYVVVDLLDSQQVALAVREGVLAGAVSGGEASSGGAAPPASAAPVSAACEP
jgi:hypothetical protein